MAAPDGSQVANTPAAAPAPKQVGGAVNQQHPFKLTRILLTVSVRTDFLVRAPFLINPQAAGGVEFHFTGEAVPHVSVGLPFADVAVADGSGVAKLDVTTVPDGTYNLTIYMATPATATTNGAAGPPLAKDLGSPPSRIYRPLIVSITLTGGKITAATDPYDPDSGLTWGRIGNRNQTKWTDNHLPIDLRPVWMKSPRERGVRDPATVTLIVCHCTGGPMIGPTINTFISAPAADSDSAHYAIDHDGHIIKFCRENHLVDHAGIKVVWGGATSTNPISVGIEIVHRSQEHPTDPAEIPYNKYQIQALLGLLADLQSDSDLNVPPQRIVGHSDVDLTESRDLDPGQNFPWEQVEAAGLGMIPQPGVGMDGAYGGFFSQVPGGILRSGDKDAGHIYGGAARPTVPVDGALPAIQELQQDLSKIGYTTAATGVYDRPTLKQVQKFQWHFFSFSRKDTADGRVNLRTATMIKAVVAGIP